MDIKYQNNSKRNAQKNVRFARYFAMLFVIMLLLLTTKPAQACCGCEKSYHTQTRNVIEDEHEDTREHITDEFIKFHEWFSTTFFLQYIEPALKDMAAELSAAGMQQAFAIGTFLDAGFHMETQRLLGSKQADSHANYSPSTSMCVFGSNVKSLAATQQRTRANKAVLAAQSLNRQMANNSSILGASKTEGRRARLNQFKTRYCDARMNGGLNNGDTICQPHSGSGNLHVNNDVDFMRMVDTPRTLNIDFTDTTLTNDEIDIIALGHNLYGHETFSKLSQNALKDTSSLDEMMDIRGVLAKRAAARNSYDSIVALKARGGENAFETALYMRNILGTLGMSESGIRLFLSGIEDPDAGHDPSYYAQLDILARKIYQSPSFYVNLYDKPANVERKKVAMQAIGLMLDRETFKSEMRSEVLLSLMLEMETLEEQDAIENRLRQLDTSDENISDRGGTD